MNDSIATVTLSDKEFQKIRDLVYEKAGINLHEGKKTLVQARLGKIIRRDKLAGFNEYYRRIIHDRTGNKLVELLDTISTNHTYFFREEDHLQWLNRTILPEITELDKIREEKEMRVWSAGCSTGEEPYTLALHILDNCQFPEKYRLKILATDLSTKVIRIAEQGVYPEEKVRTVPRAVLLKYFSKGKGKSAGYYRVQEHIRQLITFRKLNLLDTFPFRKQFALVFCRNVMIYFDRQVQERVVQKMFDVLMPGGYFVVGHSESLSGVTHDFSYIAPTIYKKPL
ncbi:MAG: protein-glutamate O-methyltransferase [Candidatus Marinimicrobia bacterium]|nr:protein-glutamate O-methyltransferase [Candidatus Neomarinimicrobiota bacterium]MCF7880484.1 protein-glutamate O-methyltransferase [Candidatus Neomarinimicrobiota bacterium]